ncbi:MAG: four-helix bundle copper-binding protein [Nitrospira sp. CR1.1]|nr:four-helix bundle copper-binding protein [Nitrospira sp. CR1.1]
MLTRMAASVHSVDGHRLECIQACLDCARICNTCGDEITGLEMPEEEVERHLRIRCIRLCRDCADICILAAQWMGRTSACDVRLCAFCIEMRELCAGVCEQRAPHQAMCGECAKECRRCAELCHKMVLESVPSSTGGTA